MSDTTKGSKKKSKKKPKDEFFVAGQQTTLAEAKQWLRARFTKGATCPCCNQFVKLYPRKLNKSMAYVLLLMECHFRSDPVEEWLHVPSYITEMVDPRRAAVIRGGDFAKLKYWGLIEEKPDVRDDGSPRVGYWKLTPLGRQFCRREVKVPRRVYTYNSESLPWGVAEKLISIDDALGDAFRYDEIMAEA